MTVFQKLNLLAISKLGKTYKHIRPGKCPKCGSRRIWGHGFTARYFDGFVFALFLKRWNCADCGCVISVRPLGYFSRHHVSITDIYNNLKHKIATGTWIRGPDLSRQRQGHWLRSLKENINSFLGFEWRNKLLDGFKQIMSAKMCPVIRST
jgi:hypothetical protein